MRLDRYFATRFLRSILGMTGIFFLLITSIDLVEHMRRLGSRDVTLPQILELVVLNAPQSLYDFLPLIFILATITMFLALSRSSELVVTRAAGRSALRTLMAPLTVALIIGVISVVMFNPIVAATAKRYSNLYENYRTGGSDTLSVSSEGLWLRQGGADGQTVIRAARANAEATNLYDVTMITYGPGGGGPIQRIEAAEARLDDGAWQMKDVKVWPLNDGINPEANAQEFETYVLPSTLTEARIRNSFGSPSAIPIWQLPAYVRQLEEAGFSARRHQVWFQMELARPLFLAAMVLIGAAFTMRPARFGKTGVSVLASILLGFTLYYIRNFAQVLGENGQIPIMLAAWAPPVATVLLAIGILLQMEDG